MFDLAVQKKQLLPDIVRQYFAGVKHWNRLPLLGLQEELLTGFGKQLGCIAWVQPEFLPLNSFHIETRRTLWNRESPRKRAISGLDSPSNAGSPKKRTTEDISRGRPHHHDRAHISIESPCSTRPLLVAQRETEPSMGMVPPTVAGPQRETEPGMGIRPPTGAGPQMKAEPSMRLGPPTVAGPRMKTEPGMRMGPPMGAGPQIETEPGMGMGPAMGAGPQMKAEPGMRLGPPTVAGPRMKTEPGMRMGPPMGAGPQIETEPGMGMGPAMGACPQMKAEPGMRLGPPMGAGPQIETEPGMGMGPVWERVLKLRQNLVWEWVLLW